MKNFSFFFFRSEVWDTYLKRCRYLQDQLKIGSIHRGRCVGVICCSFEKYYDFRDNGTWQAEEALLLLTKVLCDDLKSQKLLFSPKDVNTFLVYICSIMTLGACLLYTDDSYLKSVCWLMESDEWTRTKKKKENIPRTKLISNGHNLFFSPVLVTAEEMESTCI